jgi:hypothetical protein
VVIIYNYNLDGHSKVILIELEFGQLMQHPQFWIEITRQDGTKRYYGGDAGHNLVFESDQYRLTEYGSLAAAQTNYWETDDSGYQFAFLPNGVVGQYVKVHFVNSGSGIQIYEMVARRIVIAEDIAVENLSAIVADIGTITAGNIQSDDYSGTEGMIIDLDNKDIEIRKSGVDRLIYDGGTGNLSIRGDITVTGGSGIGNLTDAGALATEDDVDWSTQVSGSGKPDDNADVTASNTAAAIAGQGSLATKNNVGKTDCDTTLISGGYIATNLVSANSILANAVTSAKINAGAVTATSVGTNEIVANTANIKNGVITSAKIGTAEVETLNIDGNAVVLPQAATGSSSVTVGTSDTLLTSVSITIPSTASSQPVQIIVSCGYYLYSGDGTFIYGEFTIKRGSTELIRRASGYAYQGHYDRQALTMMWIDTPGSAATYTYYFYGRKTNKTLTVYTPNISVLLLKR